MTLTPVFRGTPLASIWQKLTFCCTTLALSPTLPCNEQCTPADMPGWWYPVVWGTDTVRTWWGTRGMGPGRVFPLFGRVFPLFGRIPTVWPCFPVFWPYFQCFGPISRVLAYFQCFGPILPYLGPILPYLGLFCHIWALFGCIWLYLVAQLRYRGGPAEVQGWA